MTRAAVLAVVIAWAAAATQPAPRSSLSETLKYDRDAPTGVIVGPPRVDRGAVTREARFVTSPDQQLIADLTMVLPEQAPEDCAAILFVHWFAPPDPTSNRTQFLDEAKEWARRGVVSLLPSAYWEDQARYRARTWQTDFANSVDQAVRLRRVLRLLASQRCVNPSRIAIVGHDYGAMFGSLVAAVEPEVKALVLIAGVPSLASWYEFGSATGVPAGDDLTRYRADLARIAPGHAVSLFKGPTLFQFGTKDKYTPKDQYEAFYAASAGAKEMKTYDAGHDMSLPQVRADRTAWLAKQLGVQ